MERERIENLVASTLDADVAPDELARRAYTSRTQLFRFFRALAEETPEAMRRRLRLERAAWQLSRTRTAVTEIAFDASYGSLEAFTRAFRKAFRISPSLYRRMGATHFHLVSPNGIHFQAAHTEGESEGDKTMDLFDMFNGADTFHIRKLLEGARTLGDDQLDRPLDNPKQVYPWEAPAQSLRQLLVRLVGTKELWTAAMTGGSMPEWDKPASPADLLARLDIADTEFRRVLTDVRDRHAWSDTFVDALCEPPEKFTFGGTFAHIITFSTYQRLMALDALRRLGVAVEGFGCPSEFESSAEAAK